MDLHATKGMDTRLSVGRRGFLAAGAGAAMAAAGLSAPAYARPARPSLPRAPRARNVIFMVADGMSAGTLTIADSVRRMRDGKASAWCTLWERPGARRTAQKTQCADAFVTDSAAAAAAWGCGFSCNTGVLNVTPDGRQRLPILAHARQCGKATGVVTTTRVTHATPAGFCVNIPHRDLEDAIAEQMLERGFDVMLGGGAKHFPPELIAKYPDLKVVRTAEELRAAPPGRLLGIFSRDHIPHVVDRTEKIPTLEAMSAAALDRLAVAPEGFVLQIEGGRVDHAAHDNDAVSLVHEQLEFDRTLEHVMQWMEGRDDTLLIVTTDHGNANPGLTLYGRRGEESLHRLLKGTRSFETMLARIARGRKERELGRVISEVVEEGTGVALETTEVNMLASVLQSQRVMPFRDANNATSVLGSILASTFGVAFTSPNHTSDMVELTSLGPGSDALRPVMHNNEVWQVLVQAMCLEPARLLPGMDQLIRLNRVEGD